MTWISVKERMPERHWGYFSSEVLTWNGVDFWLAWWHPKGGDFTSFDGKWESSDPGFIGDRVTHWQPLPAPPEETP